MSPRVPFLACVLVLATCASAADQAPAPAADEDPFRDARAVEDGARTADELVREAEILRRQLRELEAQRDAATPLPQEPALVLGDVVEGTGRPLVVGDSLPGVRHEGPPPPEGTRVRILEIGEDDSFHAARARHLGRECELGNVTQASRAGFYSGPFRCGSSTLFALEFAFEVFGAAATADPRASAEAAAPAVVDVPEEAYRGRHVRRGTRFKLLAIHSADRLYPESATLLGLECRAEDHLRPVERGWFEGTATCGDWAVPFDFQKVAVAPIDSKR